MPPAKTKRSYIRYSPEIAERICAGLAEGRKLRAICADEGMPTFGTVFRWLGLHADFRALYDRAREDRSGTRYSPQLALAICEELLEGRSLRSICADEGMPSPSNVFVWLAQHAEFRELYTRARQVQADILLDEILDIADDDSGDLIMKQNGSGPFPNPRSIQRARLRIAVRRWLLAVLIPKKYGAKLDMPEGGHAPVVKVVREIVAAKGS